METEAMSVLAIKPPTPKRKESRPEPQALSQRDLEVTVLYTTIKGTLEALKTAADLAEGLGARIRLLVPQVVPYPLPIDEPPVVTRRLARQFRTLALDSRIPTRIEIRLCRDRWEMLEHSLRPGSLVVLGGRHRWWPTPERRLAKKLTERGHQVAFAIHL
jgi:hypothetical protein